MHLARSPLEDAPPTIAAIGPRTCTSLVSQSIIVALPATPSDPRASPLPSAPSLLGCLQAPPPSSSYWPKALLVFCRIQSSLLSPCAPNSQRTRAASPLSSAYAPWQLAGSSAHFPRVPFLHASPPGLVPGVERSEEPGPPLHVASPLSLTIGQKGCPFASCLPILAVSSADWSGRGQWRQGLGPSRTSSFGTARGGAAAAVAAVAVAAAAAAATRPGR